MKITDRSDGGASPIHPFGHDHLATSDLRAHTDTHDLEGFSGKDNAASQNPKIPPYHESPEVSLVQQIEPCTANYADEGGSVESGLPVIAKADSQLARAHEAGSITAEEHRGVHEQGISAIKCDLTKSAPSISIGHPVRARSGRPNFATTVGRSSEPLIMGTGESSGRGASVPVIAKISQPRASTSVGQVPVVKI